MMNYGKKKRSIGESIVSELHTIFRYSDLRSRKMISDI